MDHQGRSWNTQAPGPEKTSELYIRDYPHRSIAIVSSPHALILRYSTSANELGDSISGSSSPQLRANTGDPLVAKCMVEFVPISNSLLKDYRPLTSRPIYGTLGLITVNNEVFLSVITHASRVATVRPGETVERIASVAFYCLSSANYDDVVPLDAADGDSGDSASNYSHESANSYGQGLGRRDVAVEHPCHELRKLLGNGSFYYSTDFDVTTRLQNRPVNSSSFDIDDFDDTYLWNSFMISPLVQFRSRLMPHEREALDTSRILTSAARGFCKTITIPQSSSPLRAKTGRPSFLTLTSRLSCLRAGTRFNARGIDDDGHVANFVETETTFWAPSGTLFSYVQVRGSIPIFWEQAADLVPGRQRVTVTRSPDGTQPAFNKHFADLEHQYGAVHVVNLLSESKPSEVELADLYKNGIRHSPLNRPTAGASQDHALLRATHYDFHAETKGPAGYEAAKGIRKYLETSIDGFAYYLAEETNEGGEEIQGVNGRMVVVLQQEGAFRTNCLDCLDRTNLIQTLVSQMAVETFLGHRGEYAAADFWVRHSTLWADNGDLLSKIYAGTGALKSSYTRHGKMSLAGAVADMRKSVQRIYHNNFLDPSRQITIDILLGRLVGQLPVHLFDPISDFISTELGKRSSEYTSSKSIGIWVGTFNLNGRTTGIDQDLSAWLFPPSMGSAQPEIYAVGFQEIVELSPQQIMNSDPSRKHLWEQAVKRTLNKRQTSIKGEKYVLLRSGQLVGAALCIFVKATALPSIKNVEGSVKKTGMSGMAGNKGAVAIRLDYENTHICFVTAHLAAGFANYDERNRDYSTIHNGLRFQRNRSIDDHDAVIWLGDFNYRIGLSSEVARALTKRRDLEKLYENDQLNLQMVAGLAFPFYNEARITFMPTYKFDLGTDEYDSSEKARIPAWTDRILRKGPNLRQLLYDSAPLRFSDHRPVYAAFECRVNIVDEARREAISQELYNRRKEDVGSGAAHVADGEDTDDEELIGYEAIEPGLPPASSDRQKWWLDNKSPARAQITVPSSADGRPMIPNPNRPSNPFGRTDDQDWVSVASVSSRASFSSLSSSPYEKVHLPRSAAATTAGAVPRKVPSSYDAGRTSRGAPGQGSEAPPPPPPRRQTANGPLNSVVDRMKADISAGRGHKPLERTLSTASQTSQHSRSGKPAPPVAKKPAHLMKLKSPQAGSSSDKAGHEPSTRNSPLQASNSGRTEERGTTESRDGTMARKPVVGSRSQGGPDDHWNQPRSDSGARGVGLPGMVKTDDADKAPALPSRKPVAIRTRTTTNNASELESSEDLLDSLDGGGQELGGWETLQPSGSRQ